MSDTVVERRVGRGGGVATLALVLSIIALVLAIIAYNKATGQSFQDRVQSEVQRSLQGAANKVDDNPNTN